MRIRDIVRSVSMYYSACIVGAIALLVPTAANAVELQKEILPRGIVCRLVLERGACR